MAESKDTTNNPEIKYGFCHCGCGQKTKIAERNRKLIGHVKGQPLEFINGHNAPQTVHGDTGCKEYSSWQNMRNRCNNKNCQDFLEYGARGISVCERWDHYECFLEDMGRCPPGHSIDRFPDNNGNYEPGNCRWATPTQQARNTRSNRVLEHKGKVATMAEWAHILRVSPSTICVLLRNGHDMKFIVDRFKGRI